MDYSDIPQVYRLRGMPTLLTIGRAVALEIHPDRVLPYWVFAIMTSGSMPVRIGGDGATVPRGHYFLLPPSVRHFGTARQIFETVYFHFEMEGEPVQQGERADARSLDLPVYGPMPPEIDYLNLGLFLKRQVDVGAARVQDIAPQLLAIMGQAAMAYRGIEMGGREAGLARSVLELLLQRYGDDIAMQDIAEGVGYSYGHLERVFRREYGMTIGQKLTRIRIDEAAAMLAMGKSIKDTARAVGFSDYYYFLRTFKKTLGVTPGSITARWK